MSNPDLEEIFKDVLGDPLESNQEPEGCRQPHKFRHALFQSLLFFSIIYGIPKLASELIPGSEDAISSLCTPGTGILLAGESLNLLFSKHSENPLSKLVNIATPLLTIVGSFIAVN
jgi:hypothetical protein